MYVARARMPVCMWLAQVLAVAVSAVTDLSTRQAFVKAEQLQQQGGDVPVSHEAAVTCAVVESQKAVKRAITMGGTSSLEGGSSSLGGRLRSRPGKQAMALPAVTADL